MLIDTDAIDFRSESLEWSLQAADFAFAAQLLADQHKRVGYCWSLKLDLAQAAALNLHLAGYQLVAVESGDWVEMITLAERAALLAEEAAS
jgi:hypothetical protein